MLDELEQAGRHEIRVAERLEESTPVGAEQDDGRPRTATDADERPRHEQLGERADAARQYDETGGALHQVLEPRVESIGVHALIDPTIHRAPGLEQLDGDSDHVAARLVCTL